jgi:transposase
VYFAGRWLSLWDSYGLADFEPRAGSIRQDARGRWYLNVGVRKGHTAHKCALLEVLADKMPSRGIDLGLEALASISDAQRAPVPSGRQGFGIREWRCVPCGSIHDRDTNAAQNIFAAGHRRLAAGNLSLSEEVDVKARSQRIV